MTARKAFLSAGGLFMMLIVMLGVLGIVNGLWSKNLVVEGTVSTGDLNADWDCGYTNDDGRVFVIQGGGCANVVEPGGDTGRDPINFDWPNFIRPVNFVQKDVGECDLTIGNPVWGDQWADVTIKNAYPSYECTITLFLTNTGSIPFNIISANIVQPVGQDALETVDAAGFDQCDLSALANVQVDPGEEQEFNCTVHVKEIAAQSDCTGTTDTTPGWVVVTENCDPATQVTYQFALDVCVAQWNEAASPEQCKDPVGTGLGGIHEGPPATTFGP